MTLHHVQNRLLPSLAEFGQWLAGRPWDLVVGYRCNAVGQCPLSMWLQQALRARCVVVDDETVAIERLQDEWTFAITPSAYRRFIETIDYAGETPHRHVQVLEVRHVLRQLSREEVLMGSRE